jgi:hypothetical protein
VTRPLADALREDEESRWTGTVEVERDVNRALMVTDRRIVLEDPVQPGGWVGLDIQDLAEHGTLLPYSTVLAIAAQSTQGPVRYSLRAVEPHTFDGIDWPRDAQPLIDKQLADAAASRERVRQSLGRIVAVTIAGLGLLLVILAVVLLVT